MKLGMQSHLVFLAAIAVSVGCGDDGGAPQGEGSSGGSSSSTTDDGVTTPGSTSSPDPSTTGNAESSSSTDATSSSSTGAEGSSTTTGETEGSSSSTGSVDTVTLSGVVSDFASGDPLENIEVCVFEQPGIPCATSDAAGAYSLMGVPVAEGAIEFNGANRFPSLFWGAGPMEDDVLDYRLLSTLAATVLAVALDEQIDDNLGHLALGVTGPDGMLLEGVSFTMDPPSGALGYITPDGIDPILTATSQVGFAGWVNVDVGEVEITASHPTLNCVPGPGSLIGSSPDALRIDVTAGYLGSTFPFECS